jgi:DNA ligase D-like protein (predicted ligase)
MECLPVNAIPDGPEWTYEIKLDGYRAEAVKHAGKVALYSRRKHLLNNKFSELVVELENLPDETVVDGELVALDKDGKPSFNLLQNFRSMESHIVFYAFDVLVHKGKDVTALSLERRRKILASIIPPQNHVGISQVTTGRADILNFVRTHGLEGVVAKRTSSVYQAGKRTGLWCKQRVHLGQELVIGGYIPGSLGVDSIVIGFYAGNDLYYAARVRAGFVPATRRAVFEAIKHLKTTKCPFVNLPEKEAGRWGQGFTAEKMKEAVWVRPEAVAQIEFLEWTGATHLRHTKFVHLRNDKDPRKIVRET